jgi:hypothetical protein
VSAASSSKTCSMATQEISPSGRLRSCPGHEEVGRDQGPARCARHIRWTRLSCRSFAANAVRRQLHVLAYDLGNFMRTLVTPEPIKDWSLTSLREKLIKIGAKLVSHSRYVAFQMAELAVSRHLLADILRLITELRPQPPPAPA